MTPNQRKHAKKAIRTFYKPQLTDEIERLITLATYDLYFGPIGALDDDGNPWPGFSRSCELISAAIDPSDLWVDLDAEYATDSEPEWGYDPDDEESTAQDPESWCHFEARDVKRAIFGAELAGYV